MNQLQQLQTFLLNLQNQRSKLQLLETNRIHLSNQASMVAEAESLGTALASHPLNTLSQRFSVFKQARNEFVSSQQALIDQSTFWSKQMANYETCLKSIESGHIRDALADIAEAHSTLCALGATQEFDLIKEFLENSAQAAIYVQSCQLGNELQSMVMQEIAIVQQALERLAQYGLVAPFQPHSLRHNHRLAKFADWSRFLSQNSSVQDCNNIVAQYHTQIGEHISAKNVSPQQIIQFSYQLQANVAKHQFELQKCVERLRFETDDVTSVDDIASCVHRLERQKNEAKAVVVTFAQENNYVSTRVIAAKMLSDLNNRMLLTEKSASISTEAIVDLVFNGNWFLDEMFMNSFVSLEMAEVVQSLFGVCLPILNMMTELKTLYDETRTFDRKFAPSIVNEIIDRVVAEDQSVLDMISTVSSLHENLPPFSEMLNSLNAKITRNECHEDDNVIELRQRYEAKKKQFMEMDDCDVGGQLFLKIIQPFESLQTKHEQLLMHCDELIITENVKRINQVNDSIELAVSFGFLSIFSHFFFLLLNFLHSFRRSF